MEELSKALENEGNAHKNTGLNKSAHGVYTILESLNDLTISILLSVALNLCSSHFS